MQLRKYNRSTVLFFQLSIIAFVVVLYRSILIPFTHDEVASFIYFIQNGDFLPFSAHVDANNHVLNSGLSFLFFKLLGDSPFVLRLPNLIAFIFLIIGTFRIGNTLNSVFPKIVLYVLLLFFFPFISFFSVSRGYGLSMGLMVLGLSYLINYIENPEKIKYFIFQSILLQLALSSNLTLIILITLVQCYIFIFQLVNRKLFKLLNLFIHLINFTLIFFWINYLLFLKENNALYLGKGSNIWDVTFQSIFKIFTLNANNGILNIVIFIFLLSIVILSTIAVFKYNKANLKSLLSDKLFMITVLFILLFTSFFVQKSFLNINYPEGRAALFIFPLFILIFVFYINKNPNLFNKVVGLFLSFVISMQLLFSMNFSKHSIEEYVTIPDRFYTYLTNEQANSSVTITIGGHPYRELIYNFINYRNGGKLNLENPPDKMNLYSDYYIADIKDSGIYNKYYTTIDSEPNWGFTLLKRKEFIQRKLIWESDQKIEFNNDQEFNNLFCFNDTILSDTSPLLIDLNFDIKESPVPNLSRIILQIDDSLNETNIYKRLPLNWLKYDWNNSHNNQYQIMTEEVPIHCKKLICYIWNLKKEKFHIIINKIKIYRLSSDMN